MSGELPLLYAGTPTNSAVFSECTIHEVCGSGDVLRSCSDPSCVGRLYRYALVRRWGLGLALVSIGLNPSTADADKNDPTITRDMKLAQRLGYAALIKGNLFAFRSTDPKKLRTATDPIGPENDEQLLRMARVAGRVVVSWGADKFARERAAQVVALISPVAALFCLGQTPEGAPRHPLDRSGNVTSKTDLVPFEIHP